METLGNDSILFYIFIINLSFILTQSQNISNFLAGSSIISHLRYRRGIIEEDDCPEFHNHPRGCRQAGCVYICGDNRCTRDDECGVVSGANQNCQNGCDDICLCKASGGCEFDPVSGGCRPGAKERNCHASMFDAGECSRGLGAYYSVGGRLCKNSVARGNCFIDEVIKAVNFGGGHVTDSRGISYQADSSELYVDQFDIRETRSQLAEIQFIHEKDKELYKTFLYGDPSKVNSNKCVSYLVQLCQDGKYELAVRVAEDELDKPGIRKFSILFGEVEVFPEVDLFYLTSGKYRAADLYVNFEVTDSGKKLRMKGHPVIDIQKQQSNNVVNLDICYSVCDGTTNRNFLLAGFSVVRLSATQRPESACAMHTNDPCACRQAGNCEFNVITKQCIGRRKTCSDSCETVSSKECRRSGQHIFYVDAGVVCNSLEARGNCKIAQTMAAVNFYGEAHTDVRGIKHVKGDGVLLEDPFKTLKKDKAHTTPIGIPLKDLDLYNKYIWGKATTATPGANTSCVTYYVPTAGDGNYELSLKTGESFYKNATKVREFSFKFNKKYVVQEFDATQYRPMPYGFELNVNFKISGGGKKVAMKGHPESNIWKMDRTIPLQFCVGLCTWPRDRNWYIGSFSVIKFAQ